MKIKISQTIQLNYEVTGTGPNVILLHGNGEDLHIFDALVSRLKASFTVYAVDSRDHGKSTQTNEPFNYNDLTEDIHLFIQKLQLEEVTILGFSDGGIIALLLGIRQERYLRKLISLSPNLSPKDWKKAPLMKIQERYRETKDPMFHMMLNEPNIDPKELKNIVVPTLITAGEHDLFYRSMYRTIEKRIPEAELQILKGEDHSSYIIDTDKMAEAFRSFILR
ncbi:alpha/beta fold hydrolase [Marinilactibacillus sp. Marseille-P9653]|uniref:alpha/beta fold hydrolase n=1 Tax=Marinilactibacillus sp. Marseille-P9653 TaxID=2866583 RepID=UPI001CE3E4C0|nr:alpha/beta hydrolase [Marinilactibacillus sp. Marseille-P9653]